MNASTLHSAAMKDGQKLQSSTQASHESKGKQKNNESMDASVSASSNDNRKISRQDIELVQKLIERCLQLYMNRDEVVKTLLTRARIDPGFTTLVWQKLEEENSDFFRAYYLRMKLKKQIIMFNHLLEHQNHLMKYPPVPPKVPLVPIQPGILPMAPVKMPMGYQFLQHPQIHVPSHPHPMGISNCNVVNGVTNFQPLTTNSANNNVVITPTTEAETPQVIPPNNGGMSEIAVSPVSVASSSHFPLDSSDKSAAMAMDFTAEVGEAGTSGNTLMSLDEIPWHFSLSDLAADFSNLGDLEDLENYTGSPFLPSDSDILLDSPDPDIDDFLVDYVPGPPFFNPDEDKS